jgi:hypothetical protein
MVRFPREAKAFSPLQNVQADSGAHLAPSKVIAMFNISEGTLINNKN